MSIDHSCTKENLSPRLGAPPRNHIFGRLWTPRALLAAGVILRLLVFAFLSPTNNDSGHLDNLQFMTDQRRLPFSGETSQSYHPPLAYLLAFVPFALGGAKGAQAVSLLFSLLTLNLIYRALCDGELIRNERTRVHGMAFASFAPEFVLFGLFVSNDSLSMLLGVSLFLAFWQLVSRGRGSVGRIALLCGLGLLTKHTFIAFVPVLATGVFLYTRQRERLVSKALGTAAVFVVVSATIGSYKFIENHTFRGRALVSNVDDTAGWVQRQRALHDGIGSYLNVDLIALLKNPTGVHPPVSYPLMFYSTMWYPRIGDGNVATPRLSPYCYVGSAIYVVALVPTLLCLFALLDTLLRGLRAVPVMLAGGSMPVRELISLIGLGFLATNAALLVSAVIKYEIWSILQARLLLPSGLALLVAYDDGLTRLMPGCVRDRLLGSAVATLVVLYLVMYGIEGAYQVADRLDQLSRTP